MVDHNTHKAFLSFNEFRVDSSSGLIEGSGMHEISGSKYLKYRVQGKINFENGDVNFKETFPNDSDKAAIQYVGKFDKYRFMISGECSEQKSPR